MTTRKEMVEACEFEAAEMRLDAENCFVRGRALTAAASQLTRDGELREALKKLVETWRNQALKMSAYGDLRKQHETLSERADELSALLKED